MHNTADKIKDAADSFAETAASKAKEGLTVAGNAAVKAGKPKRSPMKVTLFTVLGAAIIGAVVVFWSNQNS